ncbi:hypothetical protein INR49_030292 [Caranx melampygus]|nr:hypothetical protein INR49_030292 [Caranx melampygus]
MTGELLFLFGQGIHYRPKKRGWPKGKKRKKVLPNGPKAPVTGYRYLDEAEREKMQYAQELKEYQQTEAYQITTAKIQDKRIKKAREAELRRLRKANIEFEEQNAVLQRHIKDMYNAKERLEAELGQDEKRTQALQQHLLAIKHTLVNSLSSVPLPGTGETASLGNLDSYLSRLSGVLEGNPHKHRALLSQLCEVLSHLDSEKL